MRIGLDVTNFFFGLTGGTSVYLYNLSRALLEVAPELELHLVYNHWMKPAARQILAELAGPRVHVLRTRFLVHGIPPGGWWYPRHPDLRRVLPNVDVFHAGDFVWPRRGPIPVVVTVYDLTTRLFPQHHQRENRWRDGKKLRWACRTADRFLAVSEATKRDLVRHIGVRPDLIDVTPLARGHRTLLAPDLDRGLQRVRERYGLGQAPYILTVGTLEPRKNHARLIQAFDTLAERFPDVRLVLAGSRGWGTAEIGGALRNPEARDRIRWLGFVSAVDLQALYAGARAFAYPSLYEGFGLPVLEAMAAGVPVLTSNVSSLPEIAGEAALLVDPLSVEAIRSALERLLQDGELRARLAELGRERERRFTWRKTAERTLEAYHAAIAGRSAATEATHR